MDSPDHISLDNRIRKLERRLMLTTLIASGAVVAAVASLWPRMQPTALRVSEVRFVNHEGDVAARLGMTRNGSLALGVQSGRRLAEFGLQPGMPSLSFFDPADTARLRIGVGDRGPQLLLTHPNGVAAVRLAAQNMTGNLVFLDEKREQRLMLSFNRGGSGIYMRDGARKQRVLFDVSADSSRFIVTDSSGRIVAGGR